VTGAVESLDTGLLTEEERTMSKGNEAKVAEGRIVAVILAGKWVKGKGHEVCFAKEGEQGYYSTGDDPSGGSAPWYWGDPDDEAKSFEAAQALADDNNAKRGISKEDSALIVAGSMRESIRNRALIDRERDKMDKAVPEYAGCIPYRILFSLFDYVIAGQDPGGFLEAFLSNDLNRTLMLADSGWTLEKLQALRSYLNNTKEIPQACWTSAANVAAWKKAGGKIGKGWVS
jgi:hypothetical protein